MNGIGVVNKLPERWGETLLTLVPGFIKREEIGPRPSVFAFPIFIYCSAVYIYKPIRHLVKFICMFIF